MVQKSILSNRSICQSVNTCLINIFTVTPRLDKSAVIRLKPEVYLFLYQLLLDTPGGWAIIIIYTNVKRHKSTSVVGLEFPCRGEAGVRQFIQVLYPNNRGGSVDDITLEELIQSKRISHFYRPAENRWVDTSIDPVRKTGKVNMEGRFRRASDRDENEEQEDEEEEQKLRGLFSGLFKRRRKVNTPRKPLDAHEWFEKGFLMLHTTDDCDGAVRALASSIRLNPTYDRAYVKRGLAYEKLGNAQQAIEDYSRAIFVNPDDAKVYYLRGLALKRLGMHEEAVADIKKAADLGHWPACNFLKFKHISW